MAVNEAGSGATKDAAIASRFQQLWVFLTTSRDQGSLVSTVIAVLLGLAGAFLYTAAWNHLSEFAAAALVAAAAAAFGALVGFLFALPRTTPDANAVMKAEGKKVWSNSNLEQISDWLVKILVGVGLTQISTLPGHIAQLVQYLDPFVGSGSGIAGFVLVLLVYFAICGFTGAYTWTRTFLPRVLAQAEPE